MEQNKKDKIPNLIAELYSPNEKVVLKAIAAISGEGDERMVIPMLKVYADWDHPEIRQRLKSMLYQLKTEKAGPELIRALQLPDLYGYHELILASLWNSGLFPQDDLKIIVGAAIQGDYMVALEALTVIENMVGPFDHDELADVIADTQEYLDENTGTDKAELVQNLQQVLIEFQNY